MSNRRQLCVAAVGLVLFVVTRAFAAPTPYVWVEGEHPASANFKWTEGGSSHPEWLSGAHWLTVAVDADKVASAVPADGGMLTYTLAAPEHRKYELWARLGFETARSPFDWKIDAGDWQSVTGDALTTDEMELDFFAEVAWLKLADVQLSGGDHTLTIRLRPRRNKEGKYERLLFGLDAICLSAGPFQPHSRYKPAEVWRTPRDEEAARHVFVLPQAQAEGGRSSVDLSGLWEIARDDEELPKDVGEPIKALPEKPLWSAIAVPGDRDELRPDLLFAHRFWYRTRVNVPASDAGQSFFLTFPQNCLNTTVYVNGVLCGFNNNPYVHFDIDLSKGIKPGRVNEIWVGMRDAWYGYSSSPTDPMKLRRHFALPPQVTHNGFQDLAYPIWGAWHSGILQAPTLTVAGSTYASDVFVKPSVARKALDVDVTLRNPTPHSVKGELFCEAMEPDGGRVVKTLDVTPFELSPGADRVVQVTGLWADPKLWWPDDPHLYALRTTVRVNGQATDRSDTSFGFREWSNRGKDFLLNGVPWHGWNMGVNGSSPDKWLAFYRKTHQTQMRLSGAAQGGYKPFFGMSPDQTLDWMDRHGVVVRRCGILDGEAIGYQAIETDTELKKFYGSEIKMQLMNNWLPQMVAQVKGERNHPSIQLWSIENEWLYINCINLYGGLMDQFEAQAKRTADAVRAADPTRLVMTDGGGANKDQSMQVHGNHYVALDNPGRFSAYPAQAYLPNPKGGGRGRWVWDEKRPRYLGEDFFFTGNHPELSTIGGESALTGKAGTLAACGLALQMLQQGYRWAGFGAWDFYCGPSDADDSQWLYFWPRAVLCKEWDWTFGSDQKVKRTLGIFNDTHSSAPITFDWSLMVDGKKIAAETGEHRIPQGTHEGFEIVLPIPPVDRREEGQLTLTLSVTGKEVFQDTKAVSVLPAVARTAAQKTGERSDLAVYDPDRTATTFLQKAQIPFTVLTDLKSLPTETRVLLVGKDAITTGDRASSALAAWAAAGRTVIVLEQSQPLEYQAIPAEIDTAANEGRVAFIEDAGHPAFDGLKDKDFFTWGEDQVLYRNAYVKPARGAKSLLACDEELRNSALIEVPVDKGLLILCQLSLEEKLAENAVAQTLLSNLIRYGERYKLTFRQATVTATAGSELEKAVGAIGLTHTNVQDPLKAIEPPGERVAVIEATAANLGTLAAHVDQVRAFTDAGGWIVFNNLSPDGLADYDKLVGFNHMIRPFKRERVTFPAVRSPLTAGITAGDVAMYSSKRIFPWTEGNYVVSDEFSYVVDYDDVAPFATSSFFGFDNIVNGFTNADGWPLIINFPIPGKGYPSVSLNWDAPQTITEFTWIGNMNYFPQTQVRLVFDGDEAHAATFDTQPTGDPQTFRLDPPRTGRQITLQITKWQEKPGSGRLVGIDNIYLKAQRPPSFYVQVKPLLNVGGMMEYPRGRGGIVLCNLKFQDSEEVAINAIKKRTILATLLRNLKAPFNGGRSIIVGADVKYAPIDISKLANQYRTERGWYGEKQYTFADLPTGRQTFAGVPFDVYEFATSPVPTVIMLGGPNVPNHLPESVTGIPVHRKADALFFLQAARIDRRLNNQEKKEGKQLELARYVIHYADGQTAVVPVYSEQNVENYRQEIEPQPLPGARVAWSHPYESGGGYAVAYQQQWNNPRPEAEIDHIDLLAGKDKSGVPAVLAVTAATAR